MTEALKALFFGRLPLVVARSLRREPCAWRADTLRNSDVPYNLTHRNGTEVWTANGPPGLHIAVPGCRKWGDVTLLSAFGLSPGHHLVWRAAKRWLRANNRAGDPVAVFLAGAPQ